MEIHEIQIGREYGRFIPIKPVYYITPKGKKVKKWLCLDKLINNEVEIQRPTLLRHITLLGKLKLEKDTEISRNRKYQKGIRNRLFDEYKSNAHKRNHEFKLSFEEFDDLISGNCIYCGNEPVENKRFYNRSYKSQPQLKYNGIDRIDSNNGYTLNNTASCCSVCNLMKNILSKEDFLNHISKIYQFNSKSSTTIPKGSTSKANVDGNGVYPTNYKEDKDIV